MDMGSPKDRAAITALLNDMAKAWNSGNAAAFCDGFIDKVDFTTADGTIYTSREALQQHLAELFRSAYKGAHADFQIRRIFFVRRRVVSADLDVTITRYRSLPPGLSARGGQPVRLRVKYIVTTEAKGWKVVTAQESAVHAGK